MFSILNLGHVSALVLGVGSSGGSRISRRGTWTPEAATFRKICMSKRKNQVPWGGGGAHAGCAPLNPPMGI